MTRSEVVLRTTVRDPDGLHARPCARIAEAVERWGCDAEIVVAGSDGARRAADARSIFQMLGLCVLGGAEIEVRARGDSAVACAEAIVAAVAAPASRAR